METSYPVEYNCMRQKERGQCNWSYGPEGDHYDNTADIDCSTLFSATRYEPLFCDLKCLIALPDTQGQLIRNKDSTTP